MKKQIPKEIPSCTNDVEKIFLLLPSSQKLIEEDDKSYSFIRRSHYNDISSFALKTVIFHGNQCIESKEDITALQYESYKKFSDSLRRVVRQKRTVFNIKETHYGICEYLEMEEKMYLLRIYNLCGDSEEKELPEFLKCFTKVEKSHRYNDHYLSMYDKSGNYDFVCNYENVRYEKRQTCW